MIRYTLFILTVLFISSCSNAGKSPGSKAIYENYITQQNLQSIENVNNFRLHDWRSLGNHYVVFSSSQNRSYLVQLSSYCSELPYAETITVKNRGKGLKPKSSAIHVVKRGLLQPRPERCPIKSIYKVTKEQADEITQLRKS